MLVFVNGWVIIMNTTSYAWQWQGGSDPLLLEKITRPIPTAGTGEVVVANKAIALNPVDWKAMSWPNYWPIGRVPGVDGVGEIISVGSGVSLNKGTMVAYHQGVDQEGSFAEHVLVKAAALLPVPSELNYSLAATMLCPGLTAWQALQKIPKASTRTMLITGAGGVVGWYASQLALQRGFRVIVTASKKHHTKLYKAGVMAALDYHQSDWLADLTKLTAYNPLYAVIDTIGVEQAKQLAPLIAYNGHLVCVMGRLEALPTPAFGAAVSYHEVALAGIYQYGQPADWLALRKSGDYLLKRLADGSLQAPAVSLIGFNDIPKALAELKTSVSSQKIIALVAEDRINSCNV